MNNQNNLRSLLKAHLAHALVDRYTTRVLRTLVPAALCHTETGAIVGRFLLGLHDGAKHPFNLNELRRLAPELHEDCLQILALDGTDMLDLRKKIEGGTDGAVVWDLLNNMWAPQAPNA
ncbi:hypothetical protein QK345_12760 [Pseudomonas aeruginosa]|uniref:DUF7673 family protein n=1 Tax=Pseudomonas aeruginosa TaxID=287 RepID=UPI00232E0835|nr:hypothetical protein [Pseudomonas aeruginosa]MDI3655771.1 hypothetical protein [Pseudomonas aeruginosa]MDI3734642.1 hypothetical protein [Pseudomonas aeruginosa]HEJ5827367.1 hypothetical protein [Pseudomonas aeruginosa]HEJ5936469.1 hypothetical protein [Pseudomonas aeruginosa]HEK0120849.1 hypothetical protein [Pseudomonas aeruginosa]